MINLLILTIFYLQESSFIQLLRADGKYYSVIAVVLIIFLGIILYLWRLDKKLNNIEIQIRDEHKTS